jgi:Fe-S-cluster containining protein
MDEPEEKVSEVKTSVAHSPTEDEITALVTHYTCTRNCSGQKGNAAGCCTVASRDFIIGPITDPKEFLKRLSARDGRTYSHAEVFIDYKEGRKLFPDKTSWQTKEFYPALRVQTDKPEVYPCRFLSDAFECTVYSDRPSICRTYQCDHLKTTLKNL